MVVDGALIVVVADESGWPIILPGFGAFGSSLFATFCFVGSVLVGSFVVVGSLFETAIGSKRSISLSKGFHMHKFAQYFKGPK